MYHSPVSPISNQKVTTLRQLELDDPSITDKQVMRIAIDENRTIITYDIDYGELIFKHGYKPQGGVIFIRTQPTEPLETAKILEELLTKKTISFEHTLTVIDSTTIRQKKY